MGEQAMVAEGHAESAGGQKGEKQNELEPIEATIPKIKRQGGDGEEQGADQERTGRPVDPAKRDAEKQVSGRGRRPSWSRYEFWRSARS